MDFLSGKTVDVYLPKTEDQDRAYRFGNTIAVTLLFLGLVLTATKEGDLSYEIAQYTLFVIIAAVHLKFLVEMAYRRMTFEFKIFVVVGLIIGIIYAVSGDDTDSKVTDVFWVIIAVSWALFAVYIVYIYICAIWNMIACMWRGERGWYESPPAPGVAPTPGV